MPPLLASGLQLDNVFLTSATCLAAMNQPQTSMGSVPASVLHVDELRLINPGGYAETYKILSTLQCNDTSTKEFCLKIFRVSQEPERIQMNWVLDELCNQQLLINKDHINVCAVEIVDAVVAGQHMRAIVMPWHNNGNILDFVQRQAGVNILDLALDIASGLAYIHSTGLVHGNIHPGNVLLTSSGGACITDVGLHFLAIQRIYNGFDPVPTSWMYRAPEEFLAGIRDQRTDVYSFACVIYAMYIAGPPFQVSRYPYYRGVSQIVEKGHSQLLDLPAGMDEDLWRLLKSCWNIDRARRPTMAEVVLEVRQLCHA